jgi:DNA (cytosine-5)-methyltransferase 1
VTDVSDIETHTGGQQESSAPSGTEPEPLFQLPHEGIAQPKRAVPQRKRIGTKQRQRSAAKSKRSEDAYSLPVEPRFTSIEICAGAGGQAVGLHQAGFRHLALVEIDSYAAQTLKLNIEDREVWGWERERCHILDIDVKKFNPFKDLTKRKAPLKKRELDLLAGGVPCPPFSHAGKQLGKNDDRDLFPRMLELVEMLEPRAVMIENVRGIMDKKFDDYRAWIEAKLTGGVYRDDGGKLVTEPGLGYTMGEWDILEASHFGVPQLRPRAILVAFRNDVIAGIEYEWPGKWPKEKPVSVVASLKKSMLERFRPYMDGSTPHIADEAFNRWFRKATERHDELKNKGGGIAPTLVGGSKKHGGADLGPSRAKAAWRQLGISGMGVANDIDTCALKGTQARDLFGPDGPMLTVRQAAIIQGFPEEWEFAGGKTAQYRQVGNAFPPPVARAVGKTISDVLKADDLRNKKR